MADSWVEVSRGGRIESVHRVRLAVAADGVLVRRSGNVAAPVFTRSAIKPFQALPLVEDGVVDALGLTGEELALCCSSHNGEPAHVAAARSILEKAGVDEEALVCGPHAPYHEPTAWSLAVSGETPTRIHNNCSGKHAGMLALARHNGWPTDGYHRPDHPAQRRVASTLASWSGVPEDAIPQATDGCGVVTFALPLEALATAFGRLARASREPDGPAGRVVGAMTLHPFFAGGTDRLCTELMAITGGRVFAKTGAEGVYGAGVPGSGLGIAVKVEDGAKRASEPVLLAMLRELEALTAEELDRLASYAEPAVTNTLGDVVGAIRVRLAPEERDG